MAITKDRVYLSFPFEVQSENGAMLVRGEPAIFDKPAVIAEIDGVKYHLIVDGHALDEARMDDVVLNIDHEGKPAAKTRNGTLKLNLTPGVRFLMEADLSRNATGRELFEDIQNRFYDRMSFAFASEDDGESYDPKTHTRTILKVKRVFDVSAVTWPTFEQTQISTRTWAEARHALDLAEATFIDSRRITRQSPSEIPIIMGEPPPRTAGITCGRRCRMATSRKIGAAPSGIRPTPSQRANMTSRKSCATALM